MKDESVHNGSRWLQRLFWVYAVAALAVVFYVPTLIPGKFVYSDSYVFGYNNRVAFLLFVPLTAIGALWWRQFSFEQMLPERDGRVSRRSLWIGLALGFAVCAGIYWFTARLGLYGESTYLINRVEQAALGLRPYRDFEFNYGVAFVYLPIFLSRLLRLSIPNGYYFFWTLNVLAGIWMLYEVVNRIDIRSSYKNNIFLMLYLFMLPGIVTAGVSYTGFRFLSSSLLALMAFQTIRDGKLASQFIGSLQVVFFTVILLLISPELGVAFSLGISAFLFMFYIGSFRSRFWLLPYSTMLLLLTGLMSAANNLGLFSSLKSFAGGACSFPIVPAAHILMLFVTVFLSACYLAESIAKRDFTSNSLLVLLVSIPSLAASMGRCDPGHVVFNVIGLFIVCMLRLSNHHLVWKWYRPCFVIIFLFIGTASSLLMYLGEFSRAYSALSDRRSISDASTDAVILPAHLEGPAQIPFGYWVDHNPYGLEEGYFFGLTDVFNPSSVGIKINEISRSSTKTLLIPKDFEGICRIDPDGHRVVISVLFAYPFTWKAVHTETIYSPLCAYIHQNYYLRVPPEPDTYGYGIWDRKDTVTPAANQSLAP